MTWFYIGLFAYFLNAASSIISKIMLEDLVPNPWVYTFAVNVLGILVLFLIPFGFHFPGILVVIASIGSGIAYTFALLVFYKLLYKEEASQVVPIVGGITPIFVFGMAFLGLDELLKFNQVIGFVLIVFGSFMISHEESFKERMKHMGVKLFWGSVLAAFLFGLSQVLMKFVFNNDAFLDGFIWRGFGAVVGSLILLLPRKGRGDILNSFKKSSAKTGTIFLVGQIAAVLSFVLVNYAFSLGPVSLVNALSGVQYVFLFAFIVLFSRKYSKLLREPLRPAIIKQKVWSIILITLGVAALFI